MFQYLVPTMCQAGTHALKRPDDIIFISQNRNQQTSIDRYPAEIFLEKRDKNFLTAPIASPRDLSFGLMSLYKIWKIPCALSLRWSARNNTYPILNSVY